MEQIAQEIRDIKVIMKYQFIVTEKYLEDKKKAENEGKIYDGVKVEIDKGFEQRLTELYRRKSVYH